MRRALLLLALLSGPALGATDLSAPLDMEGCVALALHTSPKIAEAQARVRGYEARLAEVQAIYSPQLNAMSFLAPMFSVSGDAISGTSYSYGPKDWGPYTHLEAVLALPIYTFGRVEAGADAAQARADVERARVRETTNVLAFEVRRYYLLYLYARSLQPSLELGQRMVDEAYTTALALNAAGTGEVTQVDLMRLEYGRTEVARYRALAQNGQTLALAALKHTMGLPDDAPLLIKDRRLAKPAEAVLPLAQLLLYASSQRPEWAMLERGQSAALSLEGAERLANWPALFVAGTLNADWAPTRDDAANPYHNDPYNQISGGVAVGIKWDFAPPVARARGDAAAALGAEVQAVHAFAQTGIPLQVRKAHQGEAMQRDLVKKGERSVKATRKWLTFSATAYQTGTGEARDVLEGLVAYLSAKKTYYEHLRAYHEARAEILLAVGNAQRAEFDSAISATETHR
jgi:outer membrane protein TolC